MRLKVKGTTLKAEVKSFERQMCLWTEGLAEHAGVVDRGAVTCQGTHSCLQGRCLLTWRRGYLMFLCVNSNARMRGF